MCKTNYNTPLNRQEEQSPSGTIIATEQEEVTEDLQGPVQELQKNQTLDPRTP